MGLRLFKCSPMRIGSGQPAQHAQIIQIFSLLCRPPPKCCNAKAQGLGSIGLKRNANFGMPRFLDASRHFRQVSSHASGGRGQSAAVRFPQASVVIASCAPYTPGTSAQFASSLKSPVDWLPDPYPNSWPFAEFVGQLLAEIYGYA